MADVQAKIQAWLEYRASIKDKRVRMGMAGYAYMMVMLKAKPMTIPELQRAASLNRNTAYRFVMTLHTLKRAHIVDWRQEPRIATSPVFAWGPGQDAEPPSVRPCGRPISGILMPRKQVCASMVPFVRLLDQLQQPITTPELCAELGIDDITARSCLNALVELEEAHLPYWDWDRRPHGPPVAAYQIGPGPVERKPRMKKKDRREVIQRRQRTQRAFAPLLQVFAANEPERQAA